MLNLIFENELAKSGAPTMKKTTKKEKNFEKVAHRYDFSVLRDLRKLENMTIIDLSKKSGISPAVISKLERNQVVAGLGTLFRLAKIFALSATELLALMESRTAQKQKETHPIHGDFEFRQIEFADSICYYAEAPKGAKRPNPEEKRDGHETCWVLEGSVRITLPNEVHVISAGESLQFETLFEHTYEVLKDCKLVVHNVHKQKRL